VLLLLLGKEKEEQGKNLKPPFFFFSLSLAHFSLHRSKPSNAPRLVKNKKRKKSGKTKKVPTPHTISLIYPPSAAPPPWRIFSILANSHSLLHSGHADLVLSHLWMQSWRLGLDWCLFSERERGRGVSVEERERKRTSE